MLPSRHNTYAEGARRYASSLQERFNARTTRRSGAHDLCSDMHPAVTRSRVILKVEMFVIDLILAACLNYHDPSSVHCGRIIMPIVPYISGRIIIPVVPYISGRIIIPPAPYTSG